MRPSTVISLLVGVGAVTLALAPPPDETLRAGAATVAEAQLIEHLRELARAPSEGGLAIADLERPAPASVSASDTAIQTAALSEDIAAAQAEQSSPAARHVVMAEALNVRSGPSSQTSVVGRLLQGEQVAVVEEQGGWMRVSMSDGEGWAYSSYLATAD